VLRSRAVFVAFAALAVAALMGELTLGLITSHWGTRGTPDVSVPSGSAPQLGYAYSVEVTPPSWAIPVAAAVALASDALAWRLARRRW
jgi:hypothetical protein